MLTLLSSGQGQSGTYVELMLQAYKLRVYAEAGVFEAEDCLKASLNILDNYQVDPDAQIVRNYATRVRADGGTVEGFESTITSIKNLNNSDLYDKASLSLFSSGAKAGKAYSILPTNGIGDFDVIRSTTKTRTNRLGLIEIVAANVPSLNYDTVGGSPSILIEPQSTNTLNYSNTFSDDYWTKSSGLVSLVSITSVDAAANSSKFTPNTSVGSHRLENAALSSVSGIVTLSVFAKSDGYNVLILRLSSFGLSINFNLANGTIVGTETGVTSRIALIKDGYYRCSISVNVTNNTVVRFQVAQDDLNTTFAGDNIKGILFFGAQLETGATASSYIPTLGSAVTRNADLLSKTGISDLIGQTEGVVFIESALLNNDNTFKTIAISDGTSANRLFISYQATLNQISVNGFSQGVVFTSAIFSTLNNALVFNKIAARYSSNLITLFVNGVKFSTEITGQSLPINLNRLGFDSGSSASAFLGKVNQLQLYKTALTDAECITLTTT